MTTTTDLLRRAAELLEHASRLLPGMQDTDLVRKRDACKPTAASLLALADQMERAEPAAYRIRNPKWDCWQYIEASPLQPVYPGYTPVYLHPAPEVTRDAERYRWLRADHPYSSVYKGEPFIGQQLIGNTGRMVGDHADKAIDKAMAAMQEPKP